MEIPEQLACLFSATIREDSDAYQIRVPKQEVEQGVLSTEEVYRVAVLASTGGQAADTNQPLEDDTSQAASGQGGSQSPPVSAGETRVVEIESLGEQGDGIARVDRGFVVIVPETTEGERVEIEITEVTDTVAFGTVINRHHAPS